ncbi:hypothetical protein K431DRAFT_282899 [Polychaeton citri CBS 116435]|uniref:CUE domain-containing protein n=1 Tax=Polychaeton citri CBS 116435 TaxID=1314669 RepID=A0A9P4QA54_9PEZI|nr:hypothetical protein K431DRAFT_282899 [Polychaeton citri CBS 116435]
MAKPSLPPLAPVPPANIRVDISLPEWEAYLDAWIVLAEAYTILPAQQLQVSIDATSNYLFSFYRELSNAGQEDKLSNSPKSEVLKKVNFRLARRLMLELDAVQPLLSWEFLAAFCHSYGRSLILSRLMSSLWKSYPQQLESVLQPMKNDLTRSLDRAEVLPILKHLSELCTLMRLSTNIASFFTVGSDFLDALITAYSSTQNVEYRKQSATIVCLGLLALNETDSRNISLLSDHLYTLKAQSKGSESLLADVVTNTPLTIRLRRELSGKAADRLFKLLDELETFRSSAVARPRPQRRRVATNNNRNSDKTATDVSGIMGDVHIHKMSLVTQIQDLFPDLGAGFVLKLLGEYAEDVEQVTAHLLDDSLPPHLQAADRREEAPVFDTSRQAHVDHLAPSSTPPPWQEPFFPERRNIFDNDELDRLDLDTRHLHIGKKETITSAGSGNKAAILSALAAFDSDDDERDDTYDAEDVGGTVDNTGPEHDAEAASSKPHPSQHDLDVALFPTWKSSPELFGRTFDVRRGQARMALKRETGLTDEAIEGWALMLQRDSRRLQRLEGDAAAGGKAGYDGRQEVFERTAWRGDSSNANTEGEESDVGGGRGGLGGGRGRGRGGRGRGRGGGRGGSGNVAGPSGDASTVQAQRRKEQSKGSRANHNRRDQRAKKMARGGFAG